MKKFLVKIVAVVLALAVGLPLAACGEKKWNKNDVTVKDWGAVVENGGFIAFTEQNVYYINGVGASSEDNSFGVPVEGSLVAAKRADIESGKTTVEKCIVVPKLLVAEDYEMGVFIKGDYVYYATPSTDKTSSGSIAYDELQFMKTKLDGTATENLVKAGAVSDSYRIFESNGNVYIVVYDSANSKILCYDASAKKQVEVAVTDATVEEDFSLAEYKFADYRFAADGTVVFTATVYTEDYDEEEAKKNESYSRKTADYNRVYVYKAGDEKAVKVLDGAEGKITYSLTAVKGEYLYYSQTASVSLGSSAKNYAAKIADLYKDGKDCDKTEIFITDYIADNSVIVSASEIYVLSDGKVRKVDATNISKSDEKTVAKIDSSSTLLFVDDGYVYFVNGSSELARIKLNDVNAKYERISDGAINVSWYSPEVFGGVAYYSDATTAGGNYIAAMRLANDKTAVDSEGQKTSDEEEIDHYYFEGGVSLGIKNDEDVAVEFNAKVSEITESLNGGCLVFDTGDDDKVILDDNGLPVIAKIDQTKAAYESLSDSIKKAVADNYTVLKNYEKAYELSRILYKLNDFDKLSAEQKNAKETDYETAKAALENIGKDYDATVVKGYIATNMLWFYQTANTYFTK